MSPARRQEDGNGTGGNLPSLRTWLVEAEAAGAIAQQLAGTPFVPDSLKRWRPDPKGTRIDKQGHHFSLDEAATTVTVAAAMLTGQELGFGPMASLRSIDIINDTPALRAIALRALVQTHGHDIWVVESTATRAVVRGKRRDQIEPQQSVWTLDRARQLGLYPGPEWGNWRKQPQSQLVARATAEAARWIDSDGILGLPYIAEELADAEYELPQEQAAEGDDATPRKRTTTVARRKAAARGALPAGLTTITVADQAGPGGGGDEPPKPPPGPLVGTKERNALNAKLREAGITSRPDVHALVASWVHRAIGNAKELTVSEAEIVLGKLDEIIAAQQANAVKAHQDTAAEQTQDHPDHQEAGDVEPNGP